MRKIYPEQRKSQDSSFHDATSGASSPGGGPAGSGVAGSGGSPLPCLYSNNSTENQENISATDGIKALICLLTPYWKRAAQTLYLNVERLCSEAESIGHVGFFTLTFKENITDHKEASKRFNSLNSHFLNQDPRFKTKIITKEPQKRGAWHYHILIVLSEDIQTGFDSEAVAKGNYSSANLYLRKLWRDIRKACEKYGFGRSHLFPVKSNAEAMGRYIGKYISKGFETRTESHKGARLVTYSKGWLRNSPKFAWNTSNAAIWRQKLMWFAHIHGCTELYQLSEKLGPGWCHRYLAEIVGVYDALFEHLSEWKYEDMGKTVSEPPSGIRQSKITGEIQTEEQYSHKDRVFSSLRYNDKARTAHLHQELLGNLRGRPTVEQQRKKLRKNEENRNKILILLANSKEELGKQKKWPPDLFHYPTLSDF